MAHLAQQLESERSRVSRRLHGDVVGTLVAARLDLSRVVSQLPDQPALHEQLAHVDALLEQAIVHAREEMQRLHPALLDHFGLAAALRHRAEEAARACGARFDLDLPESPERLAGPIALAAYRIVDALLGVQPLRTVELRLRRHGDTLGLMLALEAPAAALDAQSPADLQVLRCWLESLGAGWAERRQGESVRLDLKLPLANEAAPGS